MKVICPLYDLEPSCEKKSIKKSHEPKQITMVFLGLRHTKLIFAFFLPRYESLRRNKSNTGCKSDIWKKVQVNIYCIYIGSTETNDTSAESPWSQLQFGTLKVGVALSWGCHALIEDKKSKTLRADLCFLRRAGVTPSWWCHALSPWKAYFVEFYNRAAGFWLFEFYDLSRSQF